MAGPMSLHVNPPFRRYRDQDGAFTWAVKWRPFKVDLRDNLGQPLIKWSGAGGFYFLDNAAGEAIRPGDYVLQLNRGPAETYMVFHGRAFETEFSPVEECPDNYCTTRRSMWREICLSGGLDSGCLIAMGLVALAAVVILYLWYLHAFTSLSELVY